MEEKALLPNLNHLQIRQEYENEKMKFQMSPQNRAIILQIAETILPRIFFVYEIVIN